MKAWVANGIRYPSSPRPKRCILGIGSIDPFSVVANALNIPPGKYGRKTKTQRNRRGSAQVEDHVVQFDDKRGTSPGFETKLHGSEMSRPSRVLSRCCMVVVSSCRKVFR